ncbi:hypothetical protein GZH47_32730 (plasmid) [Paenibacillus rhizovicinus]|uniref:Uncharacterized protein n=1 Tax=Paenibacillus rhizovicinus TaxID=2704463 RepID=A0A6C0PBD0_9BACL|nr:hypothetical protein [Paenibacillus rhizovicinus]QHW35665.1 hypothetical protein GZH47_32730 [Paenibacillus rhizovicinus]
MRDLRADIKDILEKYGHKVVYVRQDKRFRCDCYSERSGEPMADCPKCFGTTYKVSIRSCLTRRKVSVVPETLPGARRVSPLGNIAATTYKYYMEHDVAPQPGDLILEVEWDGEKPATITEKLYVSVPDPLRGDTGRIEFWQVYVRLDWKGDNDDATLTEH